MLLNFIVLLISFIPAAALYIWFTKHLNRPEEYVTVYKNALKAGLLCIFIVILVSGSLHVLGSVLLYPHLPPLLWRAYYSMIVLALAEELVKGGTALRVIKRSNLKLAWIDYISIMTLVALGFEIVESITYAIGTNAMQIFVRGITAMHAGFGFIMGYYYGKMKVTGNKFYGVLALLIPFLLHGIYDYTLNDQVLEVSELMVYVPILIAFFGIVLLVVIFLFTKKARNDSKYTTPIE